MERMAANNQIFRSLTYNLNSLTKTFINTGALVSSDLLSAGLTLYLLHSLTKLSPETNHSSSILFVILSSIAVLLFFARGHYHKRVPFWDECKDTIKVLASIGLLQGTLSAFVAPGDLPAAYIFGWLVNIILFLSLRSTIKLILIRIGIWQLPTIIIGDGHNAVETARAISEEHLLGYDIIAFLSTNNPSRHFVDIAKKRIPVKPLGTQPEKFLRRLNSPHIIVALEKGGLNEIQHYFDRLSLKYSQISIVPALRGLPLFGTDLHHFFSHEVLMLNLKNNLSSVSSRVIKRFFDLTLTSILLLLFVPVFIAIGLCVRNTGKQVIYGHERIGRNGKPFKCYKFRSMVENSQEALQNLLDTDPKAREEWNKDFKLKNDPRVTRCGDFLRKTSLDELPQLWNVLKGEMSLVGPRPVIDEEVKRYGEKAVFYYKAKPGITGLWQVSGRNDIDYESRIDLDVWYVRNWSLWNDLIILIRTVSVVLNRNGAY